MKKLTVVILIIMFGLMGCESPEETAQRKEEYDIRMNKELSETAKHIVTSDGLECVRFSYYAYKLGVSCNWEKYNREHHQND